MSPRTRAKQPKAKMGRPTVFRAEFIRMAAKACALGATDVDVAELLGVSVPTIDKWKQSKPEFLQALKCAKASADARVEQSLYRRAMGWKHKAVKILAVANGANQGSTVEEIPYVEHYPGDTTAQIFWLKNRQPDRWRDKSEVAVTGDFADMLGLARKRAAQR